MKNTDLSQAATAGNEPGKQMSMSDAVSQALAALEAMSPEELRAELDKHKDGPFAKALREAGAFCAAQTDGPPKHDPRAPIDGYQHDSYSAEHLANVLGMEHLLDKVPEESDVLQRLDRAAMDEWFEASQVPYDIKHWVEAAFLASRNLLRAKAARLSPAEAHDRAIAPLQSPKLDYLLVDYANKVMRGDPDADVNLFFYLNEEMASRIEPLRHALWCAEVNYDGAREQACELERTVEKLSAAAAQEKQVSSRIEATLRQMLPKSVPVETGDALIESFMAWHRSRVEREVGKRFTKEEVDEMIVADRRNLVSWTHWKERAERAEAALASIARPGVPTEYIPGMWGERINPTTYQTLCSAKTILGAAMSLSPTSNWQELGNLTYQELAQLLERNFFVQLTDEEAGRMGHKFPELMDLDEIANRFLVHGVLPNQPQHREKLIAFGLDVLAACGIRHA